MSYTALYRKFRPITFNEMVGQEHITKTLKNQIMAGRVGHAYLFNGGRGTGKTSAAKVLARAINCLNPKDGEPCNECEICKSALNGSITDIVEMDAASNNSVEDIRTIREEVNFLPTLAKYRVYIIDEVHMLSTGAFNALLKTLEEPPEHVKFILATTEPQKLPATILSRCQRFDFKKLSVEDIIKRLKIVAKETEIVITEEALKLIAILAEGALRDALSILERCIQDGEKQIDEDKIKDLVGIPKLTYITKITESILKNNPEKALNVIEEVLKDGKEITNFLWEIIKYNKDLLIYKTNGNVDVYSEEEKKKMKELADLASREKILRLIYQLSELENSLKYSSQRTILFQTGIIKACIENDKLDLEARIKKLEENMSNPRVIQNSNIPNINNNTNVVGKDDNKTTSSPKIIKEKQETNIRNSNANCLNYWPNIVNNLKEQGKVILYTNLLNTKAKELNDMTIGIEFPNGITAFGKTVLEKYENKEELRKLVSIEAGKDMQIKYLDSKEGETVTKNNKYDDITNSLGININIIDE